MCCSVLRVVLEDKQRVELGVVLACRCIVEVIILDLDEHTYEEHQLFEPRALQYVPFGVILRVPDAAWDR